MFRPFSLLLALSGIAYAQGWAQFQEAFPPLPCHDGWASCVVDGQAMTPDMVGGSPVNLRVDWDTLKPTRSFSPFTGLSVYTGGEPEVAAADAGEPATDDGVADAEPTEQEVEAERQADEAAAVEAAAKASEEEARREQQAAEAARQDAERAAAAAQREEDERRKEAERLAAQAAKAEAAEKAKLEKEAAAAAKAAQEAEARRKAAEQAEQQRRAQEEAAKKQAAEEERKRKEAEAASAAKAAEAARIKAEEDAKRQAAEEAARKAEEERKRQAAEEAAKKAEAERLAAEKAAADAVAAERAAKDAEEAKRLAAERQAAEKAAADAKARESAANDAAAAAEKPAAPAAGDDSCDNMQALEPSAMLGKLTAGQMSCLEGALGAATKMTDKKKISVVLMQNAFSKGDKSAWEELVKRHLDEIDQSDPDLCFQYTVYLASKGPSRAASVIRWANVALENRTVWTGDVYKSRVYSLYKARAAASQMLWKSAEEEHAASPSDASSSKVDKWRNMTKVNAREWYEYAKVSGKEPQTALQLCISAAGTADYCDAG